MSIRRLIYVCLGLCLFQQLKADTIPMVLVPGGRIEIGSTDGLDWERPVFETAVDSFWMDAWPVTVADFRLFVESTGYITQADSFGDAGVLNYEIGEWELIKGANWQFPLGLSAPQAIDNHPVTQVSLTDAKAYAAWAGKELPTEVEWEFAAKSAGRLAGQYPFEGDPVDSLGRWQINIWQGEFPIENKASDGFLYTCPVNQFKPNTLGLYGMSGNIWQWTTSPVTQYPIGATAADTSMYVQRGGSFLCEPSVCHGFRVSARSFCSPETSLFHVGFRCVRRLK
jgi:formylglycine-generating enzyme